MLATESKLRCPSCGSKNPASVERCRICTRSLPRDQSPSQAAYEDALYAQPVRQSRTSARWLSTPALTILLVISLIAVNYFVLGLGPSWAHRDLTERGETWRTYAAEDWSAVLPGEPEKDRVQWSTSGLERYRVGVDDRWVSTLDAETMAPAVRALALEELYATVVVADGLTGSDLSADAAAIVAATQPGTELTAVQVDEVDDAHIGRQVALTADYRGGTREFGGGSVEARLVDDGGRLYVLAAFVEDGSDPALLENLVAGFSPDSAHEEPSASN